MMKRQSFFLSCAIALLLLALSVSDPAFSQRSFKLVVNSANPVTSLTKAQVAAYYLKKTTRWNQGGKVEPVDLADSQPARHRFSEEILDKAVASMKSYWQTRIFSGRGTPPLELDSDTEVLRYVATHPDAVGYVSSGASLVDDVKAISLAE